MALYYESEGLPLMTLCMVLYDANVVHLRERNRMFTFMILCIALYNADEIHLKERK